MNHKWLLNAQCTGCPLQFPKQNGPKLLIWYLQKVHERLLRMQQPFRQISTLCALITWSEMRFQNGNPLKVDHFLSKILTLSSFQVLHHEYQRWFGSWPLKPLRAEINLLSDNPVHNGSSKVAHFSRNPWGKDDARLWRAVLLMQLANASKMIIWEVAMLWVLLCGPPPQFGV